MPRMVHDRLTAIERSPASPSALSSGLWDVLSHSITSRAKVEGINFDTGEYRIVLQGTLDLDPMDPKS
jgi:hypothetical protein